MQLFPGQIGTRTGGVELLVICRADVDDGPVKVPVIDWVMDVVGDDELMSEVGVLVAASDEWLLGLSVDEEELELASAEPVLAPPVDDAERLAASSDKEELVSAPDEVGTEEARLDEGALVADSIE